MREYDCEHKTMNLQFVRRADKRILQQQVKRWHSGTPNISWYVWVDVETEK